MTTTAALTTTEILDAIKALLLPLCGRDRHSIKRVAVDGVADLGMVKRYGGSGGLPAIVLTCSEVATNYLDDAGKIEDETRQCQVWILDSEEDGEWLGAEIYLVDQQLADALSGYQIEGQYPLRITHRGVREIAPGYGLWAISFEIT